MRSDPEDPRAGFALVAVLAVTALLSGLLLGLTLWSRNTVENAAVVRSDARMEALLRSAATVAAYQLFVLKLPADAVSRQQLALDAGTATVTVGDDSGKVDLNGASPELLEAAYRAAKLSGMAPAVFAARVADWRDGDDKPADGGAEAAAYRAAGLPSPRNGAFRTVSDLAGVLGVGPSEVNSLAPFVTVFNPAGRLNPYAASPTLLDNVTEMLAADRPRLRTLLFGARSEKTDEELREIFADQSALLDFDPPLIVRIAIDASLSGSQFTRHVSVLAAASASNASPFRLVGWNER